MSNLYLIWVMCVWCDICGLTYNWPEIPMSSWRLTCCLEVRKTTFKMPFISKIMNLLPKPRPFQPLITGWYNGESLLTVMSSWLAFSIIKPSINGRMIFSAISALLLVLAISALLLVRVLFPSCTIPFMTSQKVWLNPLSVLVSDSNTKPLSSTLKALWRAPSNSWPLAASFTNCTSDGDRTLIGIGGLCKTPKTEH